MEGKIFVSAGPVMEGSGGFAVYVSADRRVQLIEDLGLTLAGGAAALPTEQGCTLPVSLEHLDMDVGAICFSPGIPVKPAPTMCGATHLSRFAPVPRGATFPFSTAAL